MKEKKKPIIVLTGQSAAGKSDMQTFCLKGYKTDFEKFVTSTNRPIRPGEVHGKDYLFHHEEGLFQEKIVQGDFFEHEEVFKGRFYGCEYSEMERISGSGKIPLLVVDVKGALKFAGKIQTDTIDLSKIDPQIFYIYCPIEELIRRIQYDNAKNKRNDDQKTLEERYERMVFELSVKDQFENIIHNFDRHQHFTGNELINKIFEKLKRKV